MHKIFCFQAYASRHLYEDEIGFHYAGEVPIVFVAFNLDPNTPNKEFALIIVQLIEQHQWPHSLDS